MSTTWRKEIGDEMGSHGEGWGDVVSCTLTQEELDLHFDNGYGGEEGKPFTVWTEGRVYFPVTYDGSEWCSSVSRYPNEKATYHKGG